MYIPPSSKLVNQPERRWNRILKLCQTENARPGPPTDDYWIIEGWRFLSALQDCDGDEDQQKEVARQFPHLYDAYVLKRMGNQVTRSAVEAMILRGCDPEEVAEQYEVHPEVIRWYAALWYEVNPAGQSPLRTSTVTVPQVHTGRIRRDDVDSRFKLLASIAGPEVLVALLSLVSNKKVDRKIYELARSMIQIHGFSATLASGTDAEHCQQMMELAYKQMSEEGETASPDDIMQRIMDAAGDVTSIEGRPVKQLLQQERRDDADSE